MPCEVDVITITVTVTYRYLLFSITSLCLLAYWYT